MEGVQVLEAEGSTRCEGRGLFASALVEAYPRLPIEEEDRLGDPELRERFIERVLAYRRFGNASPTA